MSAIQYYVKSDVEGAPIAVYRVTRAKGLGEVWRPGGWLQSDSVMKGFFTGFDADVDEVKEDDAAKAIVLLEKRAASK